MSNPIDSMEDILKDIRGIVDKAGGREAAFKAWYSKLTASLPALGRESVTLTGDNFKKAMRQAYAAGHTEALTE